MPDATQHSAVPAGTTVTLADIAKRCNLSKGSVSRALSMTLDNCPLSPATWQRVRRVSREMGYRVNAQARALARGRSMAIGLLYEGSLPVLDSVYHLIIEEFSATLRQAGYHLALVSIDDSDQWEDSLLGGRVDGCVCLHSLPDRLANLVQPFNLPVVLLNGRSELASGSISPDDRQGAKLITEHLLDLGHRHIMMFTDSGRGIPHFSVGERQSGFLETLRESERAGIRPECFEGNPEAFAGHWAAMPSTPTAVLCYSHFEAIAVLRILRKAGVDVPGDVSIACFNDVFPVAELDPALTCMAIRSLEIGRAGGRMLLELLQNDNPNPEVPHTLVLQPELIVRESTAPARS